MFEIDSARFGELLERLGQRRIEPWLIGQNPRKPDSEGASLAEFAFERDFAPQ